HRELLADARGERLAPRPPQRRVEAREEVVEAEAGELQVVARHAGPDPVGGVGEQGRCVVGQGRDGGAQALRLCARDRVVGEESIEMLGARRGRSGCARNLQAVRVQAFVERLRDLGRDHPGGVGPARDR
ncbi:MAG: hypothetical protein ACK56I_32355, partial [bacterium]